MEEPVLKDIILSYFLPGFRSLLRFRDPKLFRDVHVTIGDLNVFREPSSSAYLSLFLMSHDPKSPLE